MKNVTDIGVEIVTNTPRATTWRRSGATGSTRSSWRPARSSPRASGSRARTTRRSSVASTSSATSGWTERPTSPAGASWSSAAAMWRWTPRAPRVASAPRASPSPIAATRDEMPAHGPEIDDAEREGVAVHLPRGTRRTSRPGRAGDLAGLRCTRMALGAPGRIGSPTAGADPGQRRHSRLRDDHRGCRDGAGHATRSRRASRPSGTAGSRSTGPASRPAPIGSSPRATSSPVPRTSPAPSARAGGRRT